MKSILTQPGPNSMTNILEKGFILSPRAWSAVDVSDKVYELVSTDHNLPTSNYNKQFLHVQSGEHNGYYRLVS